MFLDSDDEFIKDPFSVFLKDINLFKYDIIEFGAKTDQGEIYLNNNYPIQTLINAQDYLKDYFTFKNTYVMLCLRIYKRYLFFPNPFPNDLRIFEDNMALPLIISRAQKMMIIEDVFIQINSNPNSTTRKIHSDNAKIDIYNKMRKKTTLFYKIVFHLNRNLEDRNKSLEFYRFIVQMNNFHTFYASTESLSKLLVDKKSIKNEIKIVTFMRFRFVKLIKTPINFSLFLFGFKVTSIFIFLLSKLNLLLNQKLKKVI
jgi:hypothetical protein